MNARKRSHVRGALVRNGASADRRGSNVGDYAEAFPDERSAIPVKLKKFPVPSSARDRREIT
jgi:hypothetical protein